MPHLSDMQAKRLNAMIDAVVHEAKEQWSSRFSGISENEEKVAIAAACGGLLMAIQGTLPEDERRLVEKMSLAVSREMFAEHDRQSNLLQKLVDHNGQSFKFRDKS